MRPISRGGDPELRDLYRSAADWAELEAVEPGVRASRVGGLHAVGSGTGGSRIWPNVRASLGVAVVIGAVTGIVVVMPRIVGQNDPGPGPLASATGQSGAAGSATGSATGRGTAITATPRSTSRPTSKSTPRSAPAPDPSLPETRVVLVYLLDTSGGGCGEIKPVTRVVPRPSSPADTIQALVDPPTDAERQAGLTAPMAGLEVSTRRIDRQMIIDFKSLPDGGLPRQCRTLAIDKTVRRTAGQFQGVAVPVTIRLGGSEVRYREYLAGR